MKFCPYFGFDSITNFESNENQILVFSHNIKAYWVIVCKLAITRD